MSIAMSKMVPQFSRRRACLLARRGLFSPAAA